MNIQKAVMAAIAIDGYITRGPWKHHLYIKPTDLPERCLVVTRDEKTPRWEPGAEELMAEDWEVTTEELPLPFPRSPEYP